MANKTLLLLILILPFTIHARQRYEDGRPVYDDNGNLIIWTADTVKKWHRSGAPYTVNNEFKDDKKQ